MKPAWFASALAGIALATLALNPARGEPPLFDSFAVPTGSAPHDVAPFDFAR